MIGQREVSQALKSVFRAIRAPFHTRELETVDPERKKTVSISEADMRRRFRERATVGSLRWSLCEFPTDAQAQSCGLSLR